MKKKKIGNKVKPTAMQKLAARKLVENGGKKGKAMKDAGYGKGIQKNPKKVIESKGFKQLLDKYLPENTVLKKHKRLLDSKSIEHMVFPSVIIDKNIKSLLRSVGCTVKKIQRGDHGVHVWYWSPNDLARKNAIDMAYKLRGSYAAEKHRVNVDTTFKIKISDA